MSTSVSHLEPLTRVPEPANRDAVVILRAKAEDVDAFEAIYHEHAGRVYALCLRLTANPVEAKELAQDTFVRAWEALPTFRGDASITTWLHRIAVNAMLMQRRSTRRRLSRVSLVEDERDDCDVVPQGSVPPADVGSAIDLERAIAALPPGVRRAFVMHDVEGYSHEEIAQMTGLAAGTLRAQLHRARQLLIQRLRS